MTFEFNTYATVLLMSGVAALLVALVLFQRWRVSIFWFSVMMTGSAVWAIAYAFELASLDLSQMLFFINIEYFGVSFLPAVWIMFVIHFVGKQHWLTATRTLLIFIFPTVTILLVWTNQWHHAHYVTTSLDASGPFPLLSIEPGFWYRIHTVYFYFLMALGTFFLFRYLIRSNKTYRRQTLIIVIGALVPWLTNFAYLVGLRPLHHIDLTPYAFIMTAVIIAFGLTRYRLFDIVPYARERLIENLQEGMMVLDAHGRIIDLNAPVRRFFGSYTTDLIGKTLVEILPRHYNIQHLLLKQWHGRDEITLSTSSGDRVYEISSTNLTDERNQFAGTLLVMWDITERQTQARELQELIQTRNRMFTIIAHDLKGPMGGLLGILRLAQVGAVTEAELKEMLGAITENVDSTRKLLDNLLHWAKSQLAGEVVHPELFDLKLVNNNNVRLFQRQIADKGIALIDEIPSLSMVYADKDMVELVMRNLIGNAVKFCDRGDEVALRARTEETSTIVEVADTGTGMSGETLSKLFVSSIASALGTRNERGTGLGLKLCKDFVERNGGSLRVSSKLQEGTTISFTLPNRPADKR